MFIISKFQPLDYDSFALASFRIRNGKEGVVPINVWVDILKKGLKVGDKVPEFTLPSHTGEMVSMNDLIGRRTVVLFFYPKDNSPGCKKEVCAFRDAFEVFKEEGAEVIGISSDSLSSHEDFASKHALQFRLLSDEDNEVRKMFGAYDMGGIPGRVTYVIDTKGVIRYVFSSQLHPTKHIDEALRVIKEIGHS
jgi:peroxiredoxin Q/BCP